MTVEKMAKRILAYIETNEDATFGKLQELMGEDGYGNVTWEAAPNVILWEGLSQALVDALKILLPQILPVPCSPLVYLVDSGMPGMPVAESLRRRYPEPHWLPVIFRKRQNSEKV